MEMIGIPLNLHRHRYRTCTILHNNTRPPDTPPGAVLTNQRGQTTVGQVFISRMQADLNSWTWYFTCNLHVNRSEQRTRATGPMAIDQTDKVKVRCFFKLYKIAYSCCIGHLGLRESVKHFCNSFLKWKRQQKLFSLCKGIKTALFRTSLSAEAGKSTRNLDT